MEVWKTVIVNGEVYENYMVSNWGNVKSLNYRNTGKERILNSWKNKDNYLMVVLCKDGKVKKYYVHRLVTEAFLTKIPGKEFVDHINGIRDDNRIDNLRWCTHQENDYVRIGGNPIGISIKSEGLIVVDKGSVQTQNGEVSPLKKSIISETEL